MRSETDTQYDPDEDPDTGAATTPGDIEENAERDQAEGDDEAGEPPEHGG